MSTLTRTIRGKGKERLSLLFLAVCLCFPLSGWAAPEKFFLNGKPAEQSDYDAGVLVNDSTNLLRANKNTEAAQKLEQAIKLAPNVAEAHHNYALALAKLGRTAEALEQFKLTLQLNSNLDSTWLSLGGLYQSSGKIEDAIDTYKQFLQRFPKHKDIAKVSTLLEGLQKELKNGNSAAASTGGSDRPTDDYFLEATRNGIMRFPPERMPLKVFIHTGADVPEFKPGYDDILRQSFRDWSKASNGLLSFSFTKDLKDADIECWWISDAKNLQNSAEAGETRLTRGPNGIVRCTVRILTVPLLPELPMTDNRMRTIVLHEIGHALGLTGHTTNPKDAMFFSSTVADVWRDLSSRDANTIMRLYGPVSSERTAVLSPTPKSTAPAAAVWQGMENANQLEHDNRPTHDQ